MAAGQSGFLFSLTFVSLTFCVIFIRIAQDRILNQDFKDDFYHLDVSTYLIRGSDCALRYCEAVELWSKSNFDLR